MQDVPSEPSASIDTTVQEAQEHVPFAALLDIAARSRVAVRRALAIQRALGVAAATMRDGEVVLIPPEELPLTAYDTDPIPPEIADAAANAG